MITKCQRLLRELIVHQMDYNELQCTHRCCCCLIHCFRVLKITAVLIIFTSNATGISQVYHLASGYWHVFYACKKNLVIQFDPERA